MKTTKFIKFKTVKEISAIDLFLRALSHNFNWIRDERRASKRSIIFMLYCVLLESVICMLCRCKTYITQCSVHAYMYDVCDYATDRMSSIK